MARGSSSVKQVEWRRRLQRFRSSELTVAAFCAAEGVSAASFYQWRRKLASRPPRPGSGRTPPRKTPPAFQRIMVTPTSTSTSTRAPALAVRLPGGVEIELPAAHPETVRTLVAELLRVGHLIEAGRALESKPPC